jgi:hypothetical protein
MKEAESQFPLRMIFKRDLCQGNNRTYTFWRFALSVDLAENEMVVAYSVNNGPAIEFWVPGQNQNMRWAAHSVRLLRVQCS